MCTLSFLPLPDGFAMAMNRDEQRSRPIALPPARHACGTGFAIYPTEPSGGTWIGLHERGVALAILNWYAHPVRSNCLSRGRIIPRLFACSENQTLSEKIQTIDLHQTNPFRLVSVDLASNEIQEFRWNGVNASRLHHPWRLSHWYSSAFDEPGVVAARSQTSKNAESEPDAGTLPWVRRLHASHQPERGPYSICMHRSDAKTVSYTEVEFCEGSPQLRYTAHCPCLTSPPEL